MEGTNTYGTASASSDAHHATVSLNLSAALPASNTIHDEANLNAASAPLYNDHMADDIPPPKADFSAPPPYDAGAKLPTYEEVQREKSLQGESSRVPLAFLAIDTEAADNENGSGLLGTDFMFFTSFLVAFLFNWIGFLLLMCFCHTIAARYGALSGFGLSLAKWTLIVKHSTDLASRENSWLWWIIMTFGLLICVRAIIQYLKIKRGWRLLSGSAQERLLFFY